MQKVRQACRKSERAPECPTAFEGHPSLLGTWEPERHQGVLLFSHGPWNSQCKEAETAWCAQTAGVSSYL